MNRRFFPLVMLLSFALFTQTNCRFKRGNGNITTKEVSVGSFDRVQVHGALDVYVTQGPLQPVRIEGDENLLRYIIVEERGGELEVRNKSGVNLRPTKQMKIYVSSPNYSKLTVSGACSIIGQTTVRSESRLEMGISGAGNIKMDADAPELKARISGAGKVNLTGKTRDFELELSGAGKANCYDLLSENAKVRISGAGSAEVHASVRLEAEVSGAGNVRYRGNAPDVKERVSGAGSVKKAD